MGAKRVRVSEAAMAETYKELHEGLPVDKFVWDTVTLPKWPVQILGRMVEIQYRKRTAEPQAHSYKHPFAPHAQPLVGRDGNKKLWLWAGRYVTTTHGIEDRDPDDVRREKLPGLPKRLIELGRLEWFSYTKGAYGTALGRYDFTERNAPIVAHDENGDLFFLRGNYALELEESNFMKRSRRVRRANPTSGGSSNKGGILAVGQRVLIATAVVGVVGTATAIGLDLAIARIAYLNGKSPYIRAGAKLGAGVVLGTASILAGIPSSVGFGFAFGAAISAAKDAYVHYGNERNAARQSSVGAGANGSLPAPAVTAQGGDAWSRQYARVGARG